MLGMSYGNIQSNQGNYFNSVYPGAFVIFATKRLVSGFSGKVLRVIRDSDDEECDVYFDGDDITSSSLIDNSTDPTYNGQTLADFYSGGETLLILEHYCQVSSNYLYQTTKSNCVVIVDAGTIVTEGGFVSTDYFDGVDDEYTLNTPISGTEDDVTSIMLHKRDGAGTFSNCLGSAVGGSGDYNFTPCHYNSNIRYVRDQYGRETSTGTDTSAALEYFSGGYDGSTSTYAMYVNETVVSSSFVAVAGVGDLDNFGGLRGINYGTSKHLALIVFKSNVQSQLTDMVSYLNTNHYTSVY